MSEPQIHSLPEIGYLRLPQIIGNSKASPRFWRLFPSVNQLGGRVLNPDATRNLCEPWANALRRGGLRIFGT